MKTASGKPFITNNVNEFWPQDGGLETSPELMAVLRSHAGFGPSGVAEMKVYQAVHRIEHSYCTCKRRVGNRGKAIIGERLVSFRREPEGWVLVRHVKAPTNLTKGDDCARHGN